MSVRAKFTCYGVVENDAVTYGGPSATVTMFAVVGDGTDNASWSKATPTGRLEMSITNPDAVAAFEVGRDYWLDLNMVEASPAKADPAPAASTDTPPTPQGTAAALAPGKGWVDPVKEAQAAGMRVSLDPATATA